MSLPDREAIDSALALVRAVMPPTPQQRWPLLDARSGAQVWLKHENHTPVGAFKVRGGLVYMDALRRREPAVRSVMSATRGNHGQSIAFAAARHGLAATIVVPRGNSVEKNAAMRALGAELIEQGEDFQAAREHAVRLAGERACRGAGADARAQTDRHEDDLGCLARREAGEELHPVGRHAAHQIGMERGHHVRAAFAGKPHGCLLYTSPSPRD